MHVPVDESEKMLLSRLHDPLGIFTSRLVEVLVLAV